MEDMMMGIEEYESDAEDEPSSKPLIFFGETHFDMSVNIQRNYVGHSKLDLAKLHLFATRCFSPPNRKWSGTSMARYRSPNSHQKVLINTLLSRCTIQIIRPEDFRDTSLTTNLLVRKAIPGLEDVDPDTTMVDDQDTMVDSRPMKTVVEHLQVTASLFNVLYFL